MHKLLVFLILSAIAAAPLAGSATDRRAARNVTNWPIMAPYSARIGLDLLAPRVYVDLPLRDARGQIRYRLVCRSGNQEYRAQVERTVGPASYMEDPVCILNLGNSETDTSLLADDSSSPPLHTRGYFLQEAMVGACATYPEYGLIRHFRLRGFRLTLALSDLVMNSRIDHDRRPVGFATLSVELSPDPSATSATAERPNVVDPQERQDVCRAGATRNVRTG